MGEEIRPDTRPVRRIKDIFDNKKADNTSRNNQDLSPCSVTSFLVTRLMTPRHDVYTSDNTRDSRQSSLEKR